MSKKYYNFFYTEKYLHDVIKRTLNPSTASGIDNTNYYYLKKYEKMIVKKIKKSVLNDTYKFSTYKELLLIKNRFSNPRCISIPTIKDRICLRTLTELLNSYFNNIPSPVIPQKHISTIQKNIDIYDSYLKLDLENFYGNIKHELLMTKLKTKIRSKKILNLIDKALKNPTGSPNYVNKVGIPQGIPISNILAHIFISDLDSKYLKMNNLMYCRYVDDILIFCNKTDLDKIKTDLRETITGDYQLILNENKCIDGYLNDLTSNKPITFLGYTFFKSKKSINKSAYTTSVKYTSKIAIEKKIVSLLNKFSKNKGTSNKNLIVHEINKLITGSISNEIDNDIHKTKRFGWLFFYSQINDETLLWHLDSFLNKKIDEIISKNQNLDKYITDFKRELKSFVTTYYEIRYNFSKSTYFFNPDSFTKAQQRLFLEETLGIPNEKVRKLNDSDVDKRFKSYVFRKMKRDEKDLIKIVSLS
ncbi:reverse transcriptase domain-containing protein [Enterococcus sp. LJL99]